MQVSDDRRCAGLIDNTIQVIGEPRTNRPDAHGAAITERPLTSERVSGCVTPFSALQQQAQLSSRSASVAAVRFAFVPPRKLPRERVLLNSPEQSQHFHD